MEDWMVLVALLILVGAVLFWFKVRPWWRDRVPDGWSIGPVINGKSRSSGVKLEGSAFDFPKASGSINAMLHAGIDLRGRSRLVLRYSVDTILATFRPKESPDDTATVSLMIQRKGDDYSAKGAKASYRLYGPGPQPLRLGQHLLTVELQPGGWVNVMGEQPTVDEFAAVVADLAAIHVCFGSSSARAHGVYATEWARFAVLELKAE